MLSQNILNVSILAILRLLMSTSKVISFDAKMMRCTVHNFQTKIQQAVNRATQQTRLCAAKLLKL